MGGTTFKVGAVREGLIEYQRESMVLRYHYALPKMDVVSLGLAGRQHHLDRPAHGAPHIGPRSAGSYPGPSATTTAAPSRRSPTWTRSSAT